MQLLGLKLWVLWFVEKKETLGSGEVALGMILCK